MTDVYLPGIVDVFRVIPSRPDFAVSENGKVLNLKTNQLMDANEEGLVEIVREESSDRIHIVEIVVQHWVDKLFGGK